MLTLLTFGCPSNKT